MTKRDLDPPPRRDGAGDAAVPRRPAGQPAPLPRRRRQAGVLAQGGARPCARLDRGAGATTTPTRARPRSTSCSTSRRRWRGWPTTARSSCTRGRRRSTRPHRADVGADRHRPRRRDGVRRRRSCSPACTAPRSSTSASQAGPKVTGKRGIQIWVPVADGYTFDETRAWVETISRAIGAHRARPRQLGVGGATRGGPGPARLHPERHQQDAGRAVQRPARCRRTGLGADHAGTSSTTPSCAPDRWTIRDRRRPRCADVGDPLAPLIGLQQELPAL